LDVLGEHERACFENQDSMIPKLVAIEEVLCQGAAECTASDDDDIERSGIRSSSGAAHRLVKTVTHVSAKHIFTEIRILSCWACRHGRLLD
jgi:hypothetical protein